MSHKLFRLRASRRMPLLLFPSRPAIRVCSKAGIRGLAHRAKASGGMPDHSEGGYFVLPHLAAAALRAISWRCSLVMPGDWPPKRNHRLYLDVASTSGLTRISHRTGFLREGGEVHVTESRRDRRLSVAGGRKTACNATKRRIPTSVGILCLLRQASYSGSREGIGRA